MKGRTLLLLLAALGAVVVWVLRLEPGREGGAPPTVAAAPLARFDAAAIRRIGLASATGPAFSIARDGSGTFRLDDGRGLEADASRVDGLLAALADARVERALDSGGAPDLAAFGLAPAERSVHLAGGSGETRIEVGRASPVGYRRYARVDGGPVLLVDGAIGSAVDRAPADYVERRLLPLEASRVRRIEIASPSRRLVLERPASEWRIVEPFADRADLGVAENLARSATAMVVDGLEPCPGGIPRGTLVRVDAEDGGPSRSATIAGDGGPGGRPVERLPGPVCGRILEAAARDLDRDPEGMRDTRVTVFSSPEVRRIAWAAGTTRLELRRKAEGDPWSRESPPGTATPPDTASIEGVLDSLRWLRAAGFVPGAGPAAAPLARLEIAGAAGTIDTLEFLPGGEPGTVLVRASARPGVLARIARPALDELAAKAEGLTR